MAVGNLPGSADPGGKIRDIVVVGNERESGVSCPLQAQQQGAGVGNGEPVGRSLGEHAGKSKLRDGARGKVRGILRPNPGGNTSMELVIEEAQSDQRVYVQQIDHVGHTILGGRLRQIISGKEAD